MVKIIVYYDTCVTDACASVHMSFEAWTSERMSCETQV